MERVQRIATGAMDGNIIAAIIAVHIATNATNDMPIVPAPLPIARTCSSVTIQASTVNATIAIQAGAASRSKSLTGSEGFSAFTSNVVFDLRKESARISVLKLQTGKRHLALVGVQHSSIAPNESSG
jgi:hypothetical protein